MPSPRLMQRLDLMRAAPADAGRGLVSSQEEFDAMLDRFRSALTYGELPEGDRALLRATALGVSSGTGDLIDPSELGDWSLIDAALDSGDVDALEAALDTVGGTAYGYGEAPLSDELPAGDDDGGTGDVDDSVGDLDPDAELDAAEADDDGWVGL